MRYTGLANTAINAAAVGGPALVITNMDSGFAPTGDVSVNNAGVIFASGSTGVQIRTVGGGDAAEERLDADQQVRRRIIRALADHRWHQHSADTRGDPRGP
jgi:hypothetical protein